jgi:transposase
MAPLDEYLLKEGIIFKPFHPTAVNRHKDVLGQPQKTDSYDAYAIADLLFFQHQTTETIKIEQQVGELKSLSRAYKSLTKAKTRFSNQLQQELMSYFPELLNEKIFSTITCKTALHLLKEYPTPKELLSLSVSQLASFLSSHSKGHLGEATAREIIKRASSISREPSYIESKGLIVKTLAKQILSIDENLKQIKQQIDKISKKSLNLQRIESIDGAGSILAARLIGEVISFERFSTEPKLAMFLGLAPISDDSGKRKGRHKTTHRVNKIAKDAIMQIAECNRRLCPKSKAYYQKKRAEGKSHWQAIKCLARQLVRVLWAIFRDNTFYGQPST